MSPTITGRVVDDDGNGCPGLMAEVPVEYLLKPERFRSGITQADGRFTLTVPDVSDLVDFTPSLSVRAVDRMLRPVSADRSFTVSGAAHDVGDVPLRRADRDGLLVTLLTGTAPFVSDANALKVLIDGEEAFGRVVDELERLQQPPHAALPHRIDLTQLFFARPPQFHEKAAEEEPQLIFRFVPPQIVPLTAPNSTPVPRPGDRRPERLLLDVARGQSQVQVRILLNEPSVNRREGIFWLVALPIAGAGLVGGVFGLVGFLFGIGWVLFFPFAIVSLIAIAFIEAAKASQELAANSHVEELTAYFDAAIAASAPARPQIAVRGFKQPLPNNGVMHPKMLIIDGERAVVLGSPFGQRYYDDQLHTIEDPRRGDNRSPVVHDVSVAVIGPAVRHIDETFHLLWNEDLQTPVPIPATAPGAQTAGEDGIARVQIVRTLGGRRFRSLAGRSEKGILEAYLRAFAAAHNLIFIETQYFTDSVIKDALVEVLRDTANRVQVILLLNIKPDIWRYPERQAKHVAQLRAADSSNRLGVFTRWSYDHTRTPPWVAPVYLHTKSAVVDDSWATIGSANLDGLSLDFNLLLSPLVVGETTATEVNVLMFNGGDHPPSPLVDLVRRRLWAEHLGLLAGGRPNPADSALTKPITTDWLDLWRRHAAASLQHVAAGRSQALPGFVLEYPKNDAGSLKEPRGHLAALVQGALQVRPIGTIRPFDFFTQRWTGETGEDTS